MCPLREKELSYQSWTRTEAQLHHQKEKAQTMSFILGSKNCPLWKNQSDVEGETLKAHYAN